VATLDEANLTFALHRGLWRSKIVPRAFAGSRKVDDKGRLTCESYAQ
jgi:hypothetical protein